MDEGYIYPPLEDTYQTLDIALLAIRGVNPGTVIEVGAGSGYVILNLAKSVLNRGFNFIATDISCAALRYIRGRADVDLDLVCCSLLSCFRDFKPSLIIFNTPYLHCTPQECSTGDPAYLAICRNCRGDVLVGFINDASRFRSTIVLTLLWGDVDDVAELVKGSYLISTIKNSHFFFEDVSTIILSPFKQSQ